MNQPAKLESSTVQVPPRPQFDGTSSFDPQEQTASRSRTVDERADGSNVGGGVLRRVELTNVEFHDVHAGECKAWHPLHARYWCALSTPPHPNEFDFNHGKLKGK